MSDLVKGSVLFFNLYDVAEEIKLDGVRELLGPARRSASSSTPEYVRFERLPVVESTGVKASSPAPDIELAMLFRGMASRTRVQPPSGIRPGPHPTIRSAG